MYSTNANAGIATKPRPINSTKTLLLELPVCGNAPVLVSVLSLEVLLGWAVATGKAWTVWGCSSGAEVEALDDGILLLSSFLAGTATVFFIDTISH